MCKLNRLLLSVVFLAGCIAGSFAQQARAAGDDDLRQYLNWGMRHPSDIEQSPTTMGQILQSPALPEWVKNRQVDLGHRPMFRFRVWADVKPKPLAVFLFLSFAALTARYICPRLLEDCSNQLSRQFWFSLLGGIITMCVMAVFVRACFMSLIGTPLAFLLVGLFEAGLLFGLVAAASLLGDLVMRRLKHIEAFKEKPELVKALSLIAGCFILGLIIAIPGAGNLPRIGTRLVLLIAIVGLGSLVATVRSASLLDSN